MMQCQDIDELMVEFLYQELEPTQQQAFQAHVDGCARCGAEMKSLLRTRQALRELPDAEPSPSISARLLHEAGKRAARAEERGGAFSWLGRLFGPIVAHPAWAAVASLVLVAGMAGFLTLSKRVNEQAQPMSSSTTTPVAASEPAAAAPELPRDVTVTGADEGKALGYLEPKNEAARAALRQAEEKGGTKYDVAAGGEAREHANPVVAAPTSLKKTKAAKDGTIANDLDVSDSRGNKERQGRTASLEEDQKLAKPAKPAKLEEKRLKGLVDKAPADDLGGVPAAPPPPPAPDPAAQPTDRPAQVADQEHAARELSTTRRADGAGSAGKAVAKAPAKQQQAAESEAVDRFAAPPAAEPPPATIAAPKPSSGPPAGVAPASPAPRDEIATESKPKAKQPPEQELLQQAQKQASTGRCEEALGTRDRIARMNPEFYRRRVAGDAQLKSCEAQTRKRAPARSAKEPALEDANEKSAK